MRDGNKINQDNNKPSHFSFSNPFFILELSLITPQKRKRSAVLDLRELALQNLI